MMHTKSRLVPVVLAALVLAACGSPEPAHTVSPVQTPTTRATEPATPTPTLPPTATPEPTEADSVVTPTLLRYVTSTPIPASQMRGEWRRITTADGLCTDWPVFIGVWYIGTGTTTVCYSTKPVDETTWPTRTVPLGTRVTAVDKFPPGGGEMYATDAGVCWYNGYGWECQTLVEGYPYEDIRRIDHIVADPVLMLADAVAYHKEVYSIPEIVGIGDARPTWIAVSGEMPYGLVPEIWVGTSGYGIVVIQPDTGAMVRHTASEGLPGNLIRDISAESCPKYCDFRDVWVATDNGVGHWDGQRWIAYTTADGLPSNDVRGVASSQKDTVWAATGNGAAYFDGQSWRSFTHADGLPEGDLSGVKFGEGGIWFSTRGNGLLVFAIQAPTQ